MERINSYNAVIVAVIVLAMSIVAIICNGFNICSAVAAVTAAAMIVVALVREAKESNAAFDKLLAACNTSGRV